MAPKLSSSVLQELAILRREYAEMLANMRRDLPGSSFLNELQEQNRRWDKLLRKADWAEWFRRKVRDIPPLLESRPKTTVRSVPSSSERPAWERKASENRGLLIVDE